MPTDNTVKKGENKTKIKFGVQIYGKNDWIKFRFGCDPIASNFGQSYLDIIFFFRFPVYSIHVHVYISAVGHSLFKEWI